MNFTEKQEFDVIIIGGGIIGLTLARELRKRGVKRVAILEKNSACGMEASKAAAGILAPQAEANQAGAFLQLCQQSRDLYPQYAEELLFETNVNVELEQTGTLYLAFTNEDLAELENRFEWQKSAQLPVEKLNRQEILKLEPNVSPQVLGALRFPLDWQVENRKVIVALNRWKRKNNITTLNQSVDKLFFTGNKVCLETETKSFLASNVIIASGAWTSKLLLQNINHNIEIKPIKGQIFAYNTNKTFTLLPQLKRFFKHVVYSSRGYIVPRNKNRILVGATVEDAGFNKDFTSNALFRLSEIALEISPKLKDLSIHKTWAGLRPKTPDGLPLLGEYPKNSGLYFATGHYRNGILLAPVTAKLIADKIVNNLDSPFLQIFNPSRFATEREL